MRWAARGREGTDGRRGAEVPASPWCAGSHRTAPTGAPGVSERVALPVGLVTGMGHLPHCDPGDAVEFVLRTSPRLPSAPSLPARSRREGMIAQAASGVAGVVVLGDGSLHLERAAIDPTAPLGDPDFAGDAHVGLRAFLNAVADRDGPVKVSVTGPVTFGLALHAAGMDVDAAFALASSVVRRRAAGLVEHVSRRVPQAQVVLFVDEPGMGGLTRPDFPIGALEGVDLVSSTLAAVERRAITGLHCCVPADNRLLLAAGPQILSVPVGSGIEHQGGLVGDHLERGGWVAWGAVPTDGPVGPGVEHLWRRLSTAWCELSADGCDPVQLRTQAIVTPVCGLAHHGVTQAEHVMELARSLASRLQDQAVGVRLAAGA